MKYKVLVFAMISIIYISKLSAQVKDDYKTEPGTSTQTVIIQQARPEDGIKPKEFETALISNDTARTDANISRKPKTLKDIVRNKQKNSADKKPIILRTKRDTEIPKNSK